MLENRCRSWDHIMFTLNVRETSLRICRRARSYESSQKIWQQQQKKMKLNRQPICVVGQNSHTRITRSARVGTYVEASLALNRRTDENTRSTATQNRTLLNIIDTPPPPYMYHSSCIDVQAILCTHMWETIMVNHWMWYTQHNITQSLYIVL